jgi:8-oxo-dGTP pyrophosphatase MutT (NUDIX family)
MEKAYHGAGILIWTKDKQNNILILLGKRSINPSRGKWSIPGGKCDKKDGVFDKTNKPDYLTTAIRETKEELYYEIENKENVESLWKINIPFFHFKVYSYQLPQQKCFNHNYEFNEVQWFNIRELPKNSVIFIKSQVYNLKKGN